MGFMILKSGDEFVDVEIQNKLLANIDSAILSSKPPFSCGGRVAIDHEVTQKDFTGFEDHAFSVPPISLRWDNKGGKTVNTNKIVLPPRSTMLGPLIKKPFTRS